MANQWLKLWHELPNDPKWRTIARASKTTIPVVQAIYLQVLVNASANGLEGVVQNLCTEDVASSLDIEVAEVEAVLAAMQGRVMEADKVTGWERRQAVGDDSGAERTRKWREKRAAKSATQGESVTSQNVTVTERDVTVTQIREEEIRKEKKETKTTAAASAFVLPEWVDSLAWQDFVAMRQRIRKPLTDRAKVLAVGELEKLRARGHPPSAVLNQSIMHSWAGLFEVKESAGGSNGTHRISAAQQREDESKANIDAAGAWLIEQLHGAGQVVLPEPDHHGGNEQGVADGLGCDRGPLRDGALRNGDREHLPPLGVVPSAGGYRN